jgi:hypothetical protein
MGGTTSSCPEGNGPLRRALLSPKRELSLPKGGHFVEGGPSGDPMPLRPKGPFGGRYHRKAQCKNCTYFYRLQNGCIADYTNRA